MISRKVAKCAKKDFVSLFLCGLASLHEMSSWFRLVRVRGCPFLQMRSKSFWLFRNSGGRRLCRLRKMQLPFVVSLVCQGSRAPYMGKETAFSYFAIARLNHNLCPVESIVSGNRRLWTIFLRNFPSFRLWSSATGLGTRQTGGFFIKAPRKSAPLSTPVSCSQARRPHGHLWNPAMG